MEIIRKIVFIFICIFPFLGSSQISFYKKYTSGPFDQGNGVTQLPDSSYAVTGGSGGFNNTSGQAFLMITDSLGNQKWTKDYGGFGDDIGVRVIHVPGDGFFIAGYSGSTNKGDFDFVVYKTDEAGNLEWEKMYGGPDWDILHDAALLADGGLILVGATEGQHSQKKDIFMVRTTPLGDTVWTKTIQTEADDFAHAVDTLSSTEFVIGGNKGKAGVSTGMLAAYDIDGTENWITFLDQLEVSTVNDISVYQDIIYAAGFILQPTDSKKELWLVKVDTSGSYIEDRAEHFWDEDTFYNTILVKDMSSMYVGMMSATPETNPYPGGLDAHAHQFKTSNLVFLTDYNYSGYDDDMINQMFRTSDGGLILVGTASDNEENFSNGTNVMLAKIGPNNEGTTDADLGNDLVSLMTEEKKSIAIHPNPTHSIINIPSDLENQPFELRNMQGQIVLSGKVSPTINVNELDNGIYVLRIIDGKNIWSAKIIKH